MTDVIVGCCSTKPGRSGSAGRGRSSICTWLLSSTYSAMACAARFTCKPTTSRTFSTKEDPNRFEVFHPVRLQTESAPDAGHDHVRQLGGLSQGACAPLRGIGRL